MDLTVTTNEQGVNRIEAPLFIVFAEFMGYISPLVSNAENWCEGKVPPQAIQKAIIIDSVAIWKQMQKDYRKEEIQLYYQTFYDLFFKKYDDNLLALLKK